MENVWEVVISKYANENDIVTTAYTGMTYKTEDEAEKMFRQIANLCEENESAEHFVELVDSEGTYIDGHGLTNEILSVALKILNSTTE